MQTTIHALRKLHITETARTIGFVCVLFFLPLLVSGPQLLVGSIVNLLLLGAVQKLSRSKAWPLAFLPSIGAVLHGVIFGPFTIFLVYMMPAIWLGNFVMMYIVKHISQQRLGIAVGGIAKVGLLFLVAFVLVQSSVLPSMFVQAMGGMQLATVVIGGGVWYVLHKIAKI